MLIIVHGCHKGTGTSINDIISLSIVHGEAAMGGNPRINSALNHSRLPTISDERVSSIAFCVSLSIAIMLLNTALFALPLLVSANPTPKSSNFRNGA